MRWETRFASQGLLFAIALSLATPLLASLLGMEVLRERIAGLGSLLESHRFRELTGYAALALILFALSLSLRKRTSLPLPASFPRWRVVHMVTGVCLVLLIVVHTGGRWGTNLNGWLLSALILVTFVGLAGKLAEARRIERLTKATGRGPTPAGWLAAFAAVPIKRAAALAATGLLRVGSWRAGGALEVVGMTWPEPNQPPTPRSPKAPPLARMRARWLHTHILLVAALTVLLGFHILSVYYF
jgi:hypothetical protein